MTAGVRVEHARGERDVLELDGAPPREGRRRTRRPSPVSWLLIAPAAVAWVAMTVVTAHAVATV